MVLRLRARAAFTLIEVMVAVTILALVMGSLFFTFQTAIKAYTIGLGRSEGDQLARYVVGQITSDLRNIYYKSESEYNVARRQREAQLELEQQQMLQSGAGEVLSEGDIEDILGPPIDLNFRSFDNGGADDITFVRLQHLTRREDRQPWGLARLRYFLEGNTLKRSLDNVLAATVDEDGYEVPKPTQPTIDVLARGVEELNFRFGYWYDGEWFATNDWDSSMRRYRNPSDDEEEDPAVAAAGVVADRTGGVGPAQVDPRTQRPTDNLPAWVEFTLKIRDRKNPDRSRTYKQVVQLPQSQETYIPPQQDPNQKRTRRSSRGEKQ